MNKIYVVRIVVVLALGLAWLDAAPISAASIKADALATTTTALNLRAGPGTGYAVRRVIPGRTYVAVRAKANARGWYRVNYAGTSGYVHGNYLSTSPARGPRAVSQSGTSGGATTTTDLNLRSGPGASYTVRRTLPAGTQVRIAGGPFNRNWYRVIAGDESGYVHGAYLDRNQNASKSIVVDLSDQWLYAYHGNELVYTAPVTTGRNGFRTPTGRFTIFRKVPLKTMTGSARGETWSVPNVPHSMFITYNGVALHGTYWHNSFGSGERLSHGCVNLPQDVAALLYDWAPLGTPVYVRW